MVQQKNSTTVYRGLFPHTPSNSVREWCREGTYPVYGEQASIDRCSRLVLFGAVLLTLWLNHSMHGVLIFAPPPPRGAVPCQGGGLRFAEVLGSTTRMDGCCSLYFDRMLLLLSQHLDLPICIPCLQSLQHTMDHVSVLRGQIPSLKPDPYKLEIVYTTEYCYSSC